MLRNHFCAWFSSRTGYHAVGPKVEQETSPLTWRRGVGMMAARCRIPRVFGQLMVVLILLATIALSASNKSDVEPFSSKSQAFLEAVAYSADGQTVATCGYDSQVFLWNVSDAQDPLANESVIVPHGDVLFTLAFSPDSQMLAVGGLRSLTVWQRRLDKFNVILEEENAACRSLAFSPDGLALAIGGVDGMVCVREVLANRERILCPADGNNVRSVGFSPDGRRLLQTGKTAVIWDVIRGEKIAVLQPRSRNGAMLSGAFAPDGSTIAIADSWVVSPKIMLIDADSGHARLQMTGHQLGVNALAFSPDGLTLASAGLDGSIRLWDVKTGAEKSCLTKGTSSIKALSFSPGGKELAFIHGTNGLRVWGL